MIDIENDVFNKVATKLRNDYSGIFVSGEYVRTSKTFPLVTIEQQDNSINKNMRTTDIENMVDLMFEINVYSNKDTGRKAEAKAIMTTADAEMMALGFTRQMLSNIPNLEDATIYRLTARYTASVDVQISGSGSSIHEQYIIYQN